MYQEYIQRYHLLQKKVAIKKFYKVIFFAITIGTIITSGGIEKKNFQKMILLLKELEFLCAANCKHLL